MCRYGYPEPETKSEAHGPCQKPRQECPQHQDKDSEGLHTYSPMASQMAGPLPIVNKTRGRRWRQPRCQLSRGRRGKSLHRCRSWSRFWYASPTSMRLGSLFWVQLRHPPNRSQCGCLHGTKSRSKHHQATRKREPQGHLNMAILHLFTRFITLRRHCQKPLIQVRGD